MDETKPTELLTVKELEDLCSLCFLKKEEIQQLEAQVSEIKSELEGLNEKVITYLTDLDKTNYDSAVGKISIKNIFSVSLPKTPEAKKEFFDYLKTKGIFEDLISVHSKTLNAFYKTELEIANQENKIDFKIPGLDEPFHKQSLSFKRK